MGGTYQRGLRISVQSLCDIMSSFVGLKEKNGGTAEAASMCDVATESRVSVHAVKR